MSDIFDLEMEMNSGKLAVDDQGATSQSGIWAGGDCIRSGEDLTVHAVEQGKQAAICLLYTSPSPRDRSVSRMPSSA